REGGRVGGDQVGGLPRGHHREDGTGHGFFRSRWYSGRKICGCEYPAWSPAVARKKAKPTENLWDEEWIESLAPDEDSVENARKVLTKGEFGKVESRADGKGWWVVCRGMTGTYQVSVRPDEQRGIVAECSCPSRKRPCKHALAL